MDILQSVCKFIEKENLLHKDDKLLVAVSGGIDSMVLLHMLHTAGFEVSAAHVNYNLRDDESTKDEILVREYCRHHHVNLYVHSCSESTVEFLKAGNLQEKARDLRYNWMRELMKNNSLNVLCTAHHREDVAETFLINAFRVSGYSGLKSIALKSKDLVRPLLNLSKQEISEYAKINQIPYRNDQSNTESVYIRNFIRNNVFPLLEQVFHNAHKRLSKTSDIIAEQDRLLTYFISQQKELWVSKPNNEIHIGPLSGLASIPGAKALLYGLISDYGFNKTMVADILKSIESTGSKFTGTGYRAIIDRNYLKIKEDLPINTFALEINGEGKYSLPNGSILDLVFVSNEYASMVSSEEVIDVDNVNFPLTIRKWKHGDTFCPIGMHGAHKKVSDFLIDLKVSSFQKENVYLLLNGEEIIWVVGYRLDERYKLQPTTRQKMVLSIKQG